MRDQVKGIVGCIVGGLNPQCRYPRAIFVLAHMRCGSTALSNILCSRPDISGYGEAHIRYDTPSALGALVVNQARRGAWSPRAHHLFDKVLHDRHDANTVAAFYRSRAIFIARQPAAAIRSIRALFSGLDRSAEYRTDQEATRYYLDRLATLSRHWDRFPADRRIGLTHAALLADPEPVLARIGTRLDLKPPLENWYESIAASRRGGGGDPTSSGRHMRIEPRQADPSADRTIRLDISPDLRAEADAAYRAFCTMIAEDDPTARSA